MTKLILIRHGESTWNEDNLFSGWVDIPLNPTGRRQAMEAAEKITPGEIDVCFTSLLMRAKETAAICLTEWDNFGKKNPVFKHDADDPDWHGWDKYEGKKEEEIPIYPIKALDERYYGDLQGYNKAKMADKVGEEVVDRWRNSYSVRPPGGESLGDTASRTIPFLEMYVLNCLKQGNNVLIVAHANSQKTIVMHLEDLPEGKSYDIHLPNAMPMVYQVDSEGKVMEKTILN